MTPHAIREFFRRKGPRSRKEAVIIVGASLAGLAILILGLFAWGVGHSDEFSVTWSNRTAGPITILVDGHFEASLSADESKTLRTLGRWWKNGRLVEATDESGRLFHSVTLSTDDLKRMDYQVIVNAP